MCILMLNGITWLAEEVTTLQGVPKEPNDNLGRLPTLVDESIETMRTMSDLAIESYIKPNTTYECCK